MTVMWGDRGVVVQSRPTFCDPVDYSTPGFPVLHYLPEFAQTRPLSQLMSSSHLIPCPLLFLPAIFPSSRMFSSELVLHQFCGYYFIIDIWIKISRVYLKLINVICQLQLTKARKKNKSVILVWYNTEGEMTSQVKWKSLSHVWLCDCIVHGILQARILQWVAFPFSRGPSQPRDRTQVSRITGRLFTSWAIREAQEDCSG